jgi:hypothetical protein
VELRFASTSDFPTTAQLGCGKLPAFLPVPFRLSPPFVLWSQANSGPVYPVVPSLLLTVQGSANCSGSHPKHNNETVHLYSNISGSVSHPVKLCFLLLCTYCSSLISSCTWTLRFSCLQLCSLRSCTPHCRCLFSLAQQTSSLSWQPF